MKKIMKSFIFVMAFMVGVLIKYNAYAAEFHKLYLKSEDQTIGNVTFSYYESDGKGFIYYSINGEEKLLCEEEKLSSNIISDGKTVFYQDGGGYEKNVTIYRVVLGSKKEKIVKVNSKDGFVSLENYYGGKLYYTKGFETGSFCRYDLKKKKTKIIDKDTTHATWSKQYAKLLPNEGDYGPMPLKIYDAKKNRKVSYSKKALGDYIHKNKIYYVEAVKFDYPIATAVIMRANLDGTHKKKMSKKFKMGVPVELTNKTFTYVNTKGKKVKKSFKKLK